MDKKNEFNKKNKMGVMPVPKLVITMAIPLMLSLLVQSLYNIVDGIFVAQISEDALTATSLAYPVQLLMVAVSVGTGVGVNALIARMLGAGRQDEANQAATIGLVLSLISTVVFMVLGIFCVKSFVGMYTNDEVQGALAVTYLRICMIGCLGIFIETLAQRLLQAVGNTTMSMVSLICGAVTNIILDPIMIFGYLGCPAMGIAGAAAATVIGQWVGAIVALLLNHFCNRELRFVFKGFHMSKKMIKSIYKVGFPTIITQAVGSIMLSSMNGLLISVSSTVVAFFGVYYKLQNFLYMPMNGLGQAAIPIVGYNFGAKKPERINGVIKVIVPVAGGIAILAMLIFMVFPARLLELFKASDSMLELGVPALRVISIVFIFTAVTTVLGYAASGLGNGFVNMIATAIRQLIVLVPLAHLFLRIGGVSMVWYAMWVSEVLACVYAVISIKREFRKKVEPLVLQDDLS